MSPPKATPAEQWRLVQELLDEAELERVEKMTPEEIEAAAQTSGLDEARARELLERAIAAADAAAPLEQAPAGNVVPLSAARRRRRPPGFTLAALALAAGVAAVCYVERKPIEEQWQAWFQPGPRPGPGPQPQPPPPLVPPDSREESPLDKARRLREAAYVDIDKGYFDDAVDGLNEAAYLDPAGNADARVRQAREAIRVGNPKRFLDAKTGIETWEYPLHKRRGIER